MEVNLSIYNIGPSLAPQIHKPWVALIGTGPVASSVTQSS